VGKSLGWAPETITRLPNALAGVVVVVVVAMLGRRLFGKVAGLVAAGMAAASTTLVGYQRVAKEDTLLSLFILLLCWCMAEAKAAADARPRGAPRSFAGRNGQRRWELLGAASLAGMMASKYFFFLTPIPVLFYVWVRRTDTAWRVPWRRWLTLIGVALPIWACLSWTPFLPSTWEYAKSYISGGQTVHGSLFFMGTIYPNLVEYLFNGTPPWFYLVFAAVKITPLCLLLSLTGLVAAIAERRPSHRLVLSWMGLWFLVHSTFGSKWGRFFESVMPAFLILAGMGAALLIERVRRAVHAGGDARGSEGALAIFSGVFGAAMAADVAIPASEHAPHYRLYVSPLGGGDEKITWYFPHCDYFDTGFREAMQYVAEHAEPYAEVSSELADPVKIPHFQTSTLYADAAGRKDLLHTILRRGKACRSGHPCYAIVQTGRLYFLNQDAVANLAKRTPWHVVRIRDEDVVKIYRLEPGERPYPDE
jgi:hypothetical protein